MTESKLHLRQEAQTNNFVERFPDSQLDLAKQSMKEESGYKARRFNEALLGQSLCVYETVLVGPTRYYVRHYRG